MSISSQRRLKGYSLSALLFGQEIPSRITGAFVKLEFLSSGHSKGLGEGHLLGHCFTVFGFHFREQRLPGLVLRLKAGFVQQFLQ